MTMDSVCNQYLVPYPMHSLTIETFKMKTLQVLCLPNNSGIFLKLFKKLNFEENYFKQNVMLTVNT